MEVIGMALIVGGMAYLFSGLIFLLPNPTAKRPAIVTENSDEEGCRTGVGVGAHIASQREFDSTTSRDDLS
jgi:hypothetical protein